MQIQFIRKITTAYAPVTVDFNANTYLTRGADLTDAAVSKVITFSFWLKMTGGDGTRQRIWAMDGGFGFIERNTSNKLEVELWSSSPAKVFEIFSTTSITVSSGWVHCMGSCNLATGVEHFYLNGSSDLTIGTNTNANIAYTSPGNHAIGGSIAGAELLDGEIADLYINIAEYVDLSSSANRAKFLTAAGRPVDLGADGSTPTGSAPSMMFNQAVASWHTNQGGGGGFTENGIGLTAGSAI
jgi:hypothetical protein